MGLTWSEAQKTGFLMLGPIYQWHDTTGLDKHNFSAYNCKYFLTHQFQHILCAQKKRLVKTALLSTHNISFSSDIRRFGRQNLNNLYIFNGYSTGKTLVYLFKT